jgi:hypothetical protein
MVEAANPEPKTSREIAEHLLRDVGLSEVSDAACNDALAAYDQLLATLEDIRNRHLS